jgi:Glycosyl transferases group 1
MARSLMAAIGAGGHTVDLVSDLRLYDGTGDSATQDDLRARARAEAARIRRVLKGGDTAIWVTYHNYYKAPDLIGPGVCRALNLPYVQIESSRAKSRLTGKWAGFAEAAEAASDAADLIFHLTDLDLITLKRHRPARQSLIRLRPFLPRDTLPAPASHGPAMLAAGMMRHGDKLASYRIIAGTLALLPDAWRLDVAGDGPAGAQVRALMEPFGDRVRFLGQLDRAAMARAYRHAALLFWPGVNEAYGMVYLEAQAAGLAVVAQDRPGVRDVLLPGTYPSPGAGPQALADEIAQLLATPALARQRGAEARRMIAQNHLIGAAGKTFWTAAALLEKPA